MPWNSNRLYPPGWEYFPPTPEQRAREKAVKDAELKAKQADQAAQRQAKKEAEKAAKHAANLERFREEIRRSNHTDEEKASLIEKSYKW